MEEAAGVPLGTLPLPPGIFLDVGANLGHHSLTFAKAGYTSVAVEPLARNRVAIRTSLCANPELRRRVTLLATALSDASASGPCVAASLVSNVGNAQMSCGPEESCTRLCETQRRCGHCETVNLTTLDAALGSVFDSGHYAPRHRDASGAALPMVAAKIDAEGAECGILQGGTSLFTRHRPVIVQVEVGSYGRTGRERLQCVWSAAGKFGYNVSFKVGQDNAYLIRADRWRRAHTAVRSAATTAARDAKWLREPWKVRG